MLIRTQNKVPEVYVNDSRDFQVLCRAYDFLFNAIKYDTDSMLRLLSSVDARNNILSLLQTKVGFFTNKNIDDTSLRKIMAAFMMMVRGKGSLRAIKQAVNVWLKIVHLETDVQIQVFNKNGGEIGQTKVGPYTVAIGINSSVRDYTSLKEVLRYILPAGYTLYFYFYTKFGTDGTPMQMPMEEKATIAYVSDDINSIVRNSISDSVEHARIGKPDATIAEVETNTKGKIFTTNISTEVYGSDIAELNVFEYGVDEETDVPFRPDSPAEDAVIDEDVVAGEEDNG